MKERFIIACLSLFWVSLACTLSGGDGNGQPQIQASTGIVEVLTALPEVPTLPAAPPAGGLGEIFAQVQPAPDGTVTVTITDDQVNQAMQLAQKAASGAPSQMPAMVENPQITFSGGNVVFEGDVSQPKPGHATIVFLPLVNDGMLQFEVVSAQLGDKKVPPPLLQTAEMTLNQTLMEGMNQMPQKAELQDILMNEGTMTIKGIVK